MQKHLSSEGYLSHNTNRSIMNICVVKGYLSHKECLSKSWTTRFFNIPIWGKIGFEKCVPFECKLRPESRKPDGWAPGGLKWSKMSQIGPNLKSAEICFNLFLNNNDRTCSTSHARYPATFWWHPRDALGSHLQDVLGLGGKSQGGP